MNPIYDLLRADGSIVINKNLITGIGLNESIMFCELLSRYYYFADRKQLQDDGSFFNTIFDLSLGTGLADKAQRTAITKLTKLGLLSSTVKGIPAKRYFKITGSQELITSYLQQGSDKRARLIEEHQENPLNISYAKGRNLIHQEKELAVAEGVRNNTNYNNTKEIIKSIYIDLPIDGHIFFNIYGRYFRDKFGKDHMRLTPEQLDDVSSKLNELIGCDVDRERFEEEVENHFDNLPKSNNGNIMAFLTASRRYFEVDTNGYN